MKFVTAVYGNLYVPLITTFLFQLKKVHPDDETIVLWDDINENEINLLSSYFNDVTFIKLEHNIPKNDQLKRIPLKLKYWCDILNETDNDTICFLDCDTLVYKNINDFVNKDFDFLYTFKDEKFPINVGVVIVKTSDKIKTFFDKWLDEIEIIINDSEKLQEAFQTFGAADQKALAGLMRFDLNNPDKSISFDFGDIKFSGIPCDKLNQTQSVPINCGSYIFHYKGGWQPILLKLMPFSKNRPKESALDMYYYWDNLFEEANYKIMHSIIMNASIKWKDTIDWLNTKHLIRGILHSEMLATISTIKELKPDLIIESGRFQGQSTYILTKAFEKDNIPVISIELTKDENANIAENKLKDFSNLKLLYGDTHKLLPDLVKKNSNKKIVILMDGPKGYEAYKLFSELYYKHKNIIAGFFHDCRKPYRHMTNNSRNEIYKFFDRLWFTDNEEFVDTFREIDTPCIATQNNMTEHSWKPYYKGWKKIGSYGPTIGIVLPNMRDHYRYEKLFKRKVSPIQNLKIMFIRFYIKLKEPFKTKVII